MTVGSWDRSNPATGLNVYSKSWSGTDRPKLTYPKPVQKTVMRYDKKLKQYVPHTFFEKRTGSSRPPKRAYDEDHAYSMTLIQTQNRQVVANYLNGNGDETIWAMSGLCVPNWTCPSLLTDNDQIRLIGKLREKISGSDFNLGVVLGEGHQTLRMIGDTAIRIAKSLHHLRRGDVAGAARSLVDKASRAPIKPHKQIDPSRLAADRLSSAWLELQYGWKPLLEDVKAGAEFVAHKLSVPISQTYRMSVKRETNIVHYTNWTGGVVTARSHQEHRRSMKVIVSEHPSALAQLGLLDPEVVAWELVPFSFVVDWFMPIGSWLEARAALQHIQIATYVTTDKRVGTAFKPEPSSLFKTTIPQDCQYRKIEFSRSIGVGNPNLPLPRFKPLSEALSVKHCLNGLALLNQVGLGRSKS